MLKWKQYVVTLFIWPVFCNAISKYAHSANSMYFIQKYTALNVGVNTLLLNLNCFKNSS